MGPVKLYSIINKMPSPPKQAEKRGFRIPTYTTGYMVTKDWKNEPRLQIKWNVEESNITLDHESLRKKGCTEIKRIFDFLKASNYDVTLRNGGPNNPEWIELRYPEE